VNLMSNQEHHRRAVHILDMTFSNWNLNEKKKIN
jgi:hypothetical protein